MAERAVDLAWAAGLFEGEGCVYAHSQPGGRPYPGLALGMTDRDVVERFAEIVELGSIHFRKMNDDAHKDQFVWRANGWASTRKLWELIGSYLGDRRSDKFAEVLALEPAEIGTGLHQRRKTHCPKGHAYDEENTVWKQRSDGGWSRSCRTCRNADSLQRFHANRDAYNRDSLKRYHAKKKAVVN